MVLPRGGELSAVGGLYNKLIESLSSVKAQQEAAAANAHAEGEETPPRRRRIMADMTKHVGVYGEKSLRSSI